MKSRVRDASTDVAIVDCAVQILCEKLRSDLLTEVPSFHPERQPADNAGPLLCCTMNRQCLRRSHAARNAPPALPAIGQAHAPCRPRDAAVRGRCLSATLLPISLLRLFFFLLLLIRAVLFLFPRRLLLLLLVGVVVVLVFMIGGVRRDPADRTR